MRVTLNILKTIKLTFQVLFNFISKHTLNWWPVVLAPVVLLLAALVAPVWFTLGLLMGFSIGFLIGSVWSLE